MIIRVTQEIIDKSLEKIKLGELRSRCCPIATALSEATGVPWYGHSKAFSTEYAPYQRYKTSIRVKRFVDDFDAHKPVKPFSFRFSPEVKDN